MMKHEFEHAYGRKVSLSRWQDIERAYMESSALDRLDFVAELKAHEAKKRWQKQAAKGFETSRSGITESQFRAYVRNRLQGHPLESWRDWITPELGHGNWKYRETIHPDGVREVNVDMNGAFQTYLREPNGNSYNLIFEFQPDCGGGKGTGYCYIYDSQAAAQARSAN